jgi:hypothetical protein
MPPVAAFILVAEATGPKTSERPAGAEAPGSDELMESPGPEEHRGANSHPAGQSSLSHEPT